MNTPASILLIGYGNPGRLDDGLGPALAAEVESWQLPDVEVDSDYQLTVEDASDVARHGIVIFVDASVSGREPFYVERVFPKEGQGFSTHSVQPPAVMHLAHEMFGADTRGYVLGIRGYEFDEFGERLSDRAQSNLREAAGFLRHALRDPQLLDMQLEAN